MEISSALSMAVELDAQGSIAASRQRFSDRGDVRLFHMTGEAGDDQDHRYFDGLRYMRDFRDRAVQFAVQTDAVTTDVEFFSLDHSFVVSLMDKKLYTIVNRFIMTYRGTQQQHKGDQYGYF